MFIVFILALLFFSLSFMILIGVYRGVNKSSTKIYMDHKYNEIRESKK